MPALGTARVLLWLAPLLWSSNYIIARLVDGLIAPHALPHATPHALSPGRWAVAAAIRLTWMGRGMWAQVAPVRRESLHRRVLGFLDMCICGAWVYIAARTMSSISIALIYAVTPMAIAAASSLLQHKKLSRAQWAAVVRALRGLLLAIAKADPARLLTVQFVAGDAWIVAAAASCTA